MEAFTSACISLPQCLQMYLFPCLDALSMVDIALPFIILPSYKNLLLPYLRVVSNLLFYLFNCLIFEVKLWISTKIIQVFLIRLSFHVSPHHLRLVNSSH